jgi:hypothetical protein
MDGKDPQPRQAVHRDLTGVDKPVSTLDRAAEALGMNFGRPQEDVRVAGIG